MDSNSSESVCLDEKGDSSNAHSGPVHRHTVQEARTIMEDITDRSRIDKTRIDASQTREEPNKTEESRTVENRMEVKKAKDNRKDETGTGANKTEESRTVESRTDANKTEANRLEENCDAKSSGTMYLGNLYPREIEGHDKQGPKMGSSTPDVPLSVQESEEGRGRPSKLIVGISMTSYTTVLGYGGEWILITGIGSPINCKALTCIDILKD